MEPKVIIRFLNGSRKETVAESPLKLHHSIRFGRESECELNKSYIWRPKPLA